MSSSLMPVEIYPNEIQCGNFVMGKKVAVLDPGESSAVTILHFEDKSVLPLSNNAKVLVYVDPKILTLEDGKNA
jgi:hypothetical protein